MALSYPLVHVMGGGKEVPGRSFPRMPMSCLDGVLLTCKGYPGLARLLVHLVALVFIRNFNGETSLPLGEKTLSRTWCPSERTLLITPCVSPREGRASVGKGGNHVMRGDQRGRNPISIASRGRAVE